MTAAGMPTLAERVTRATRVVADRWLDWASFLVPLAVSLAANTVWGLQSGSDVFLVAGLVTPLTLVLAVERWQKTPAYDDWRRVVQIVGMAVVALVAASWSWVHTTSLLLDQAHGAGMWTATFWLCVTAPLAVDGLAVLSVLSLNHHRSETAAAQAAATPAPAAEPAPVGPTDRWGGPDTVTTSTQPLPAVRAIPSPTPAARPAATRRRAPARRRSDGPTKRQLEARAKELGVKRRENETRDQLAARVTDAENAARPATTDLPMGVPA